MKSELYLLILHLSTFQPNSLENLWIQLPCEYASLCSRLQVKKTPTCLKIPDRSWNSGMLHCRKQENIIHTLSIDATSTQVRDNFQGAQHSTRQLFSLLKEDIKGNQRQEMVSYLIKDTFKVNGQATNSNHTSSHAVRKIDTSCLVHGRKRSSPQNSFSQFFRDFQGSFWVTVALLRLCVTAFLLSQPLMTNLTSILYKLKFSC